MTTKKNSESLDKGIATKKELNFLYFVSNNEFADEIELDEQAGHPVWLSIVADYSGLKGKSLSGVISSLTKKGYITSDYVEGVIKGGTSSSESTVALTKAGVSRVKKMQEAKKEIDKVSIPGEEVVKDFETFGPPEALKEESNKSSTKTNSKMKTAEKVNQKSQGKQSKKLGVVQSIVNMIEKSGEKGVTRDQILARLAKKFPDRSKESMRRTVRTQVPTRINRERFKLEKTENGRFKKA